MMTFAQAAGHALDATHAAMDFSRKLEKATAILNEEADRDGQHARLSDMLRVNAAALAAHPTPRDLLSRNYQRLMESMQGDSSRWPAGMTAPDIHLAAQAFWRAASALG